jgi:hypothetical protein
MAAIWPSRHRTQGPPSRRGHSGQSCGQARAQVLQRHPPKFHSHRRNYTEECCYELFPFSLLSSPAPCAQAVGTLSPPFGDLVCYHGKQAEFSQSAFPNCAVVQASPKAKALVYWKYTDEPKGNGEAR